MRAYKGFSKALTARMGAGTFKYEVGKTYTEDKAECARTGFHCCEEPIEVLSWYHNRGDRYCIVEAGGDIHEDGTNRVSCTRIEILKEVTIKELALLEAQFIINRPNRPMSKQVRKDQGEAYGEGEAVIVRGKNPKALGELGTRLVLLKEEGRSKKIEAAGAFDVDGKNIKARVYYNVDGEVVNGSVKKRTPKVKNA